MMGCMVDNFEIDIVYVVMSNVFYVENIIVVVCVGKYVICEKFMVNIVVECDVMFVVCCDVKVKLFIGYCFYFDFNYCEIKWFVCEKDFGVFECMSSLRLFNFGLCDGKKLWCVICVFVGGGLFMDFGVYVV